MCLAQFAANYTYNQGNENCIGEDKSEFAHELDSDIPEVSDETTHTNVIKLQNGLSQMRKRKKKAIIHVEKRREIMGQLHVIYRQI